MVQAAGRGPGVRGTCRDRGDLVDTWECARRIFHEMDLYGCDVVNSFALYLYEKERIRARVERDPYA